MKKFKKYLISTDNYQELLDNYTEEDLQKLAERLLEEDITNSRIIKHEDKILYVFESVSKTNLIITVKEVELNIIKWLKKGAALLTKPFKYQ